jgi:hypothetical protein
VTLERSAYRWRKRCGGAHSDARAVQYPPVAREPSIDTRDLGTRGSAARARQLRSLGIAKPSCFDDVDGPIARHVRGPHSLTLRCVHRFTEGRIGAVRRSRPSSTGLAAAQLMVSDRAPAGAIRCHENSPFRRCSSGSTSRGSASGGGPSPASRTARCVPQVPDCGS